MAALGLQRLHIQNLRNLASVDISPAPGVNLIFGANASGKTSLLEAIYVLSRGRSFRTRRFERLVRHGETRYTVFGRIADQGRTRAAAIERSKDSLRVRVDGQDLDSLAPLAALLPVQILHPNSHKLLEEGPHFRRQYLDWGVFHVEHGFYDYWQRYQRALRQRNAALRTGTPAESWEPELVQAGTAIDDLRRRYLEQLAPLVSEVADLLLDFPPLRLEYLQGWSRERTLADAISQSRGQDRERGFTFAGPHRADLRVTVDGVNAAETASRGQQKLLVSALVCAQCVLFQTRSGRHPILLVDDLAAELDRERRERFVAQLQSLSAQVFVTAIEPEALTFLDRYKGFHVEHGAVREVL